MVWNDFKWVVEFGIVLGGKGNWEENMGIEYGKLVFFGYEK